MCGMRYKSKFEKLIEELDEYEWFFDVYTKGRRELASDTDVLILDDDDEDERDEYDEPIYPASKGFFRLMSIADIRSVIENMEEVCVDFTTEKIVDAVIHYYDNDSFLY